MLRVSISSRRSTRINPMFLSILAVIEIETSFAFDLFSSIHHSPTGYIAESVFFGPLSDGDSIFAGVAIGCVSISVVRNLRQFYGDGSISALEN